MKYQKSLRGRKPFRACFLNRGLAIVQKSSYACFFQIFLKNMGLELLLFILNVPNFCQLAHTPFKNVNISIIVAFRQEST